MHWNDIKMILGIWMGEDEEEEEEGKILLLLLWPVTHDNIFFLLLRLDHTHLCW